MRRHAAAMLLLLAFAGAQAAPVGEPSRAELTRQVEALDQAFFGAFNQCRIEQLAGLVAEDLEFFHDKTGLMRSRQAFLDSGRCEGKGRYVHVWHRLDEGRWELMRVLSYEHLPLAE